MFLVTATSTRWDPLQHLLHETAAERHRLKPRRWIQSCWVLFGTLESFHNPMMRQETTNCLLQNTVTQEDRQCADRFLQSEHTRLQMWDKMIQSSEIQWLKSINNCNNLCVHGSFQRLNSRRWTWCSVFLRTCLGVIQTYINDSNQTWLCDTRTITEPNTELLLFSRRVGRG